MRRRRVFRALVALLLAFAILWVVAATARSQTAQAAFEDLSQRRDVALDLLRFQLGDSREEEDGLPAWVELAIHQSSVLLTSRSAVLNLRHSGEEGEGNSTADAQSPTEVPDESLPETPEEPETPFLFADNGVTAKTLLPSSQEGYVVTGDVYINNRSENSFDESLFDGTFDASLSQEEGPQILIVHTHGSEAYTMPEGEEYVSSGDCRTTDENYNMVRVGEEIASALEDAGLSVLHDTTLYDYPEYSGAYGRSLTAVEDYLEEYPTISFVLDVHRDAISDGDGTPYKVVSPVAGVNAAQLSFVIGTDAGGLEHPNWRENLKLAAAVQQKLCDSFPTLMRPITVRNSRYNQHTTTGSLLVEVGAAGNSLDEALLSAQLLGQALAQVILENASLQ